MNILIFIAGMMCGGMVGIFVMALMVAVRDADEAEERRRRNTANLRRAGH